VDSHIDRHFDEALERSSNRSASWPECRVHGGGLHPRARATGRGARPPGLRSDHPVNALEVSIDGQCLELLARQQPAARDLRFITRGLKIATDLERVGDLAVNTAERVLEIIRSKQGTPPIDLTEMVQVVQTMLKDAIDAFLTGDEALATSVLERDDVVDDHNGIARHEPHRAARPGAPERPKPVSSQLDRPYLERIADHSTNIAEQAIFMIRGLDVRHGQPH